MKARCTIGLHNWMAWSTPYVAVDETGFEFLAQSRKCWDCQRVKVRAVYAT